MPFIQLNDKQIPLRLGEMGLGTGADADIRVPGGVDQGALASVQLFSDNHVAIKRVHPTAQIRVNGVALGSQPSPLIHGDKIEAGGAELQFGDDKKQAFGTQVISGIALPPDMRKSKAPPKPTSATGGRLVSLVDGREFQVKPTGLTMGRDAACDVVLPGTDVSRNHAEISVSADGYYVIDLSTNGVFVNGEKIEGTHTLGRGDVIRIGTEEFRFYADVPKPAVPATGAPIVSAPVAAAEAAPAQKEVALPVARAATPAAPGAVASPQPSPRPAEPTAPPNPAFRPSGDRPLLATLEVINEGPNKGKKYEIRGPLTHIGRGAHNDVMIDDDSVSDSHAKIQKKSDSWIVADVGSTNGTYVSGKRIATDQALIGAPDVRFGGVKMMFKPAAEPQDAGKGTRAIAGVAVDQARRMSAAAASKESAPSAAPANASKGIPVAVWIAVAVVIAAVAYFVLAR